MSEPITLTLPYPPQMNHLYTIARGRKILSTKGRDYKAQIQCFAVKTKLEKPVAVTLKVFRPRKAGDLDNIFKVVLDSLTGNVWNDDKQVVEIHAFRYDDKDNPRVEIEVVELDA